MSIALLLLFALTLFLVWKSLCLMTWPSALCGAGGLTAAEHKLVAVATKLVTCPALLLLDQPLGPFCQPSEAAAAQHLLTSLRTAAHQLHINVVVTAEAIQDAAFAVVDNVVMLDHQTRPVYVGTPQKVRTL